MKKIITALLGFTALVIVSCQTIPPISKANGKGIVVVYTEVREIDKGKTFVSYTFYYDKNKPIYANPNNVYTFTKNVEPGQHTVESMFNET